MEKNGGSLFMFDRYIVSVPLETCSITQQSDKQNVRKHAVLWNIHNHGVIDIFHMHLFLDQGKHQFSPHRLINETSESGN